MQDIEKAAQAAEIIASSGDVALVLLILISGYGVKGVYKLIQLFVEFKTDLATQIEKIHGMMKMGEQRMDHIDSELERHARDIADLRKKLDG